MRRLLRPRLPRAVCLPRDPRHYKATERLIRKNTQVERQIVSSFTIEPILPRLIVRILLRVLRLADVKKTVVGVIGNAIRQFGWETRRDEPRRRVTSEQRLLWLEIEQFVTAITAKATHSV